MCNVGFLALLTAVAKIEQFYNWVSQQWTQCTQQSCNWWCLCCNKWFCWVFLVLLAILVTIIFVVFIVIDFVLSLVCGLFCLIFWGATLGFGFQSGPSICLGSGVNWKSGSSGNGSDGNFTIGGQVSGLPFEGTVSLSLSAAATTENWSGGNGGFTFPTPVPNGSMYSVGATPQPTLTIAIANKSGTVSGAAVTDVLVTCTPKQSGL
jgi:hypothetical protein